MQLLAVHIIIDIVAEVVDEQSAVVRLFCDKLCHAVRGFGLIPVAACGLPGNPQIGGSVFQFPTEILDQCVDYRPFPRFAQLLWGSVSGFPDEPFGTFHHVGGGDTAVSSPFFAINKFCFFIFLCFFIEGGKDT